MSREHLGEFEVMVLLTLVRLGQNAYGVPIRREIETRARRAVSVGALYRTLDRLEAKGYVSSWFGDPSPERGGRSKLYFRIEPAGLAALRQTETEMAAMWDGIDLKKAPHAS
jgi:PadR family transcriptional regulator PadR